MKAFAEFRENLGEVLKRRRKELGLNQAEVAEPIGLSQADVSRMERGEQGFDSRTIFLLARQLRTSLTEIFSEVEQVSPTRLPAEAVEFARLWIQLPADMRDDYRKRIEALAGAMKISVPDELRGHFRRGTPHRSVRKS